MSNPKPRKVTQVADTIAKECLVVRIRVLNRTITAIYDDALRPLGLTAGQLNVLVVITRRGPLSSVEVADILHMEKSTVSRNIGRMRDNGWLVVSPAESGNRRCLTLSRRGNALLEKSLPAWQEAQARARKLLGRSGTESFVRIGNAVWNRPERD